MVLPMMTSLPGSPGRVSRHEFRRRSYSKRPPPPIPRIFEKRGFFADLVEAVPDWPAHRDECSRRAVASARQRCVSAFFGRHLSRRARTGDGGHLHLLRVLESLPQHPQPDGDHIRPPRSTATAAPCRVRRFARSRGGCRERGLTRLRRTSRLPMPFEKTAMASCRTSSPLPTLGSTCTGPPAVERNAEMESDRSA